jgi:uncharacterized repeat protein (TIGR01451 family)
MVDYLGKKLRFQSLEPRILLDAAGMVTAVETVADPGTIFDAIPAEETVDIEAETSKTETRAPSDWQLFETEGDSLGEVRNNALVIVDTSIENYESLLENIDPSTEILLIDPAEDGFQQLADYVKDRSDISEIHILSHGDQGTLKLGTSTLSQETIGQYQGLLAEIGQALSNDGDILLYGCNLAEGQIGVDFVSELAEYTNTDVAASTDLTGSENLGGNWDLEYSTGVVEAEPFSFPAYQGELGFSTTDHNNDLENDPDPVRMITWNVIGLDSNKPETEGPNQFMVGFRVEADGSGLSGYTAKIVADDNVDIFGTGLTIGDDGSVTSDIDDGVDNIQFTGTGTTIGNLYTDINIAADGYQDFYFNVEVLRSLDSHDQIQPFHFEIWKDDGVGGGIAGNGIWDEPASSGVKLDTFSWLPDEAAANTPLYLYVEKYISQARNEVSTQSTGDSTDSAIRIDGLYNTTTNSYEQSPVTIFVGQTLNIRVEGQTATQGYPQLTLATTFDTDVFQIQAVAQAYDKPVTNTDYQQDLGTGLEANDGDFVDITDDPGLDDPNSSLYANPAGWNPSTHSLMVTSAPPKAGGGPIVTDYAVEVTGTGSGSLQTMILDYSGSSFHYNADYDTAVDAGSVVRFNAVSGAIIGNVGEDTDGDNDGDNPISGVTVTLTGTADTDNDGTPDTVITPVNATTDASGNYKFINLLPGNYTVAESVAAGFGDITDTDGGANKNSVAVTLSATSQLGYAPDDSTTLLAYERADFVEGKTDLSLLKSVDVSNPQGGSNVVFTLTVSNTSNVDVANAQVTDKLPAGLAYVSDDSGGNYVSSTGVWSAGALSAGASKSIAITAQVTGDEAITNFAEITAIKDSGGNTIDDKDSTAGNNAGADTVYGTSDDGTRTTLEDDEAKVTVDSTEADLSLIKTVDNSTPAVGGTVSFTLTVINSGPDAATGVKVTDSYPSGIDPTSVAQAAISQGSFSTATGIWDVTDNTSTPLASGASATLTFTATIDEAAAFDNEAAITAANQYDPDSDPSSDNTVDDGSDGIPDDDEASVSITPLAADISLSKTVSNTAPDIGSDIVYTLIVNNSGPNDASGVIVRDLLPAGLTYVSDSTSGVDYDDTTGLWSVGSLAVGATKVLTITATVNDSSTISNVAEVKTSSLPDPDSKTADDGGNTSTDDWADGEADDDEASISISPGATNLSLFKSYIVDDGTLDTLGETVTFTLSVVNSGPGTAYNVTVEDVLPAGLGLVAMSVTGTGTYDGSTWNVGEVANGATATMSFQATVDSVLAQTNFAQISEVDALVTDTQDGTSTLNDPDSTPNNDVGQTADEDDEALVTLSAIPFADLQVINVIDDPSPAPGSTVTFTTSVTNTGQFDTSGVAVVFTFPEGVEASKLLTSIVPTTSNGTISYVGGASSGTWTIGNLAYGETVVMTVSAVVPSGTGGDSFSSDLRMFAEVSASSLPDPDSTPNDDGGLYTTDFDDEAIATALSAGSTRIDVALSQTVAVNGGTPSNTYTSALVSGDTVSYSITADNQAGDVVGSVYVLDAWPAGLDLTSTVVGNAEGGLEYSTDGGLTYSTTVATNPTHLRWNTDSSSSGTKFTGGSSITLTLTGTVNATGAGASIENAA